ncbi:MAG: DUF3108 domain-containing protein [Zetaproteobacteria bacterium]|nr:MAG: DUF3108 domain-containing protein [Zetaproteobacteria bacterium]
MRWVSACLLLLLSWQAEASCLPFVGERMRFAVGWEFINAGTATMDIERTSEGWRTRSFARSNRLVDMFKKVRDTITAEGMCLKGRMQSVSFDVVQHEGHYHSRKETRFLWRQGKVSYTQNKKTSWYPVPAGHLSVVDAFLFTRAQSLKPGDVLRIPIFDSRKRYEVVVQVGKRREMLYAPWGERVPCIVLTPRLRTEGIFSSKGTMRIWVTDDARHIPLKMVAKIKFGHIVARLEQYRKD